MFDSALELVVRKLETRVGLSPDDRQAIFALPHVLRTYSATDYVIRDGEPPRQHCDFILDGIAFRQKMTVDGSRQIVSIHFSGDFIDLQHLFLNTADHNVEALTSLKVIGIERTALQQLVLQFPAVARAMWIEALVDSSIYREWVVNVARRDARARIAHLVCEIWSRVKAAGFLNPQGLKLPLTQVQLADAVGLTTVHVNRVLQSMRSERLIKDQRHVEPLNMAALAEAGGFDPRYLHLEQTSSANAS
ncbi:Crp/Fnr family transcriptional regulator [Novosphingobium resinovorum]|uniref:Crp/Fnr family transcriptional regulator n=1 Tax=Novosphingobium TaxID=165696 RepID=UPI001B3C61F5|nr:MULTISPECIES: Crp/Fnr family transcriptional regulator [Novosphingobium]MBF7013803.1 Crp/Fnr family transcriptional regulator [Novosphingobium sp. HR1a]WJM25947.1 Crp/Fnr family transcriptional regulator [Novosphingobium resinovorum]